MGLTELTRNAVDVLPAGELERKLARGRPLRVKLGIDVTSPDIHLGRGIPLQRMRAFQDEGHRGVLIIGDYTTRIGDPSGRSSERPILSDEEIDANAERYLEQAKTILLDDPELLEVRRNGEWLSKLSYADVVRLGRIITVARMLERDDFQKRFRAGEPISVSELLYPLMQAYGRDRGRRRARRHRPALQPARRPRGDGVVRARAAGGADDAAAALLGRGEDELLRRQQHPADGAARRDVRADDAHPRLDARGVVPARLGAARPGGRPDGGRVVERSHGEEAAAAAEEHFTRVVREGKAPEEVEEVPLADPDPVVHLPAVLASKLGESSSYWRRVIDQGGVKLDGRPVPGYDVPWDELEGATLQAGKRQFLRLVRV